MNKLGKALTWLGITVLSGIVAVRSWKKETKRIVEEEEQENTRFSERGLDREEIMESCENLDKNVPRLMKILGSSTKWDVDDFWKGGNVTDNMILVSEEIVNKKPEWHIKVRIPMSFRKYDKPKSSDYKEQISEMLSDVLGKDYFVKTVYRCEYYLDDNVIDSEGRECKEIREFPINPAEFDNFRKDGDPNGIKNLFNLFEDGDLEEIEKKFGMEEKGWLIYDIAAYLDIIIPSDKIGLLTIQDVLMKLTGFEVTNSDSGGRFGQLLGPVGFQADFQDDYVICYYTNSLDIHRKVVLVKNQ